MQKELKYLIINYSAKDLEYIDELLEYVDNASEKIVKWFGFKDFGAKPVVTIFGGTKEFYQAILDYKPEEKIYDWILFKLYNYYLDRSLPTDTGDVDSC